MSENEIPVKEISELLDVVSEKVPRMMKAVRESFFSAEAGAGIGDAVGSFYKSLIDKGIPDAKAYELTLAFLRQFERFADVMSMDGKKPKAEKE
ncbi:MAG TPA: hypothetical protein DCL63_04250 [Firmicutes bacterium]|jgi:hypothetical protein|nr:hypothetical protein [Bacillota bacterium]HBK60262.1 hypothetical protein [Bacillota bacterium]